MKSAGDQDRLILTNYLESLKFGWSRFVTPQTVNSQCAIISMCVCANLLSNPMYSGGFSYTDKNNKDGIVYYIF